MGEWFKKRWRNLEGNAVWAGLSVFAIYLLTLLPAATIKLWLYKPITNLGMLLWPLFPASILLAFLVATRLRRPLLLVRVQPTSGPSQSISLIIKNLGRTTTFSAFCEIVDHPNGSNEYRHGEFRCGWGDGSAEQKLLPKNETATVLIAAFAQCQNSDDMLKADLLEVLGGKVKRWDTFRWHEHPDERLPSFILSIRLVGERTREPKTLVYALKPCRFTGPLEMVAA